MDLKLLPKFCLFIIIIFTIAFVLAPHPASAHTPEGLELEYNYESQSLTVMITHNIQTSSSHFIEFVEIYRNNSLYISQNYTTQPTTSKFSYFYDVTADENDVIKAVAICSIQGNVTNELTVKMPVIEPGKMHGILSLTNFTSSMAERSKQIFNLSLKAGDCDFCPPVEGVSLDISSLHGALSAIDEVFPGDYQFTYTAPDVTSNTTERINITAIKDGFNTSYFEFEFLILNTDVVNGTEPMPTVDGKIEDGEYEFEAKLSGGDFKFYWTIEGDEISIGLKVKTKGWVAIAIDPTIRMKNSDMYIGWVTGSGTVNLVDAYSIGEVGPHPPDTEEGGTDDILDFAGSEDDGWTTIEFTRKLDTGDSYDKVLRDDKDTDLIWAYGNDDNFDARHSVRGGAVIDLGSGEVIEKTSLLWLFHAVWMSAAFALMITGLAIMATQKRKKWCFKVHKTLGILAALFAVLGLVSGLYMVSVSTNQHFRVLHTWLGVTTLIVVLATPFLCNYMFKHTAKMKVLKPAHRWVGRIATTLMFITIIAGLNQAGII